MSVPTLVTFLHSEYQQALDKLRKNPAQLPQYQRMMSAGLDGFVAFCEQYLAANPPREVFYAPNIGLRLRNNKSVLITGVDSTGEAPAVIERKPKVEKTGGDMQPSTAISITPGSKPAR